MKSSANLPWLAAAIAWIAVIFFSSTSLAAEWCEGGFTYVSTLLFTHLRHDTPSYNWIHLIADKGLHVTLFLVLALMLWKAFPPTPRKVILILFLGLVVGSCSEFLQRFFPGRDPAIRDVLINLGGTALGVIVSLRLFDSEKLVDHARREREKRQAA